MKKGNKIMITVAGIVVVLGTVIWVISRSLPYPIPSGHFKVGTVILDMEDSSRMEWAVSEEQKGRQFVTRIWYPANPTGKEKMLPIMEKAYAEGMQALYGFPVGAERPSYSHINAPVYLGETAFPILIFTHGGASFMTQNLTSMEELASQGFIVISLSFPYESVATIFSDGSVINMKNMNAYKAGMRELSKDKVLIKQFVENIEKMKSTNPELAKESSVQLGEKYVQIYPDMTIWLDTRVEDISYLINNLEKLSIGKQKLTDIADTENIGLFGHSLGGITTLKFLMEKDFPSVKCGIVLDAPYYITDATSNLSLTCPVLFMSSDYIKLANNKVKLKGANDFLKDYTNEDLYEVNVKGAAHFNFSDVNYLPKYMEFTSMLGSIPQEEAVRIMAFYLENYFKGYLKGGDLKKIEESISSRVEFRKIDR